MIHLTKVVIITRSNHKLIYKGRFVVFYLDNEGFIATKEKIYYPVNLNNSLGNLFCPIKISSSLLK